MSQILVRNLDPQVVQRLKDRAKANGRSLQAEAKTVLEGAAAGAPMSMEAARKAIERLRRRFKGRKFPESVTLVREDRETRGDMA